MRGKSFEIALSAIATALCVILIIIGAYVPAIDLSCYMFASVCLMLPLSKGFVKGGILAYIASAILGFFLSGANIAKIIPFVIFFGIHPIINYFFLKSKANKIVAFIIKLIWFIGALFVMYFLTELFMTDNEIFLKYVYVIIPVAGAVFFVFYDWAIIRCQYIVNIFVKRIGK